MTAQRNANRLTVTSSLAIATALLFGGAQAAKAQSFDASGTVVAGSASISTGSGTTDVFVSGNAVINWSPNDTATSPAPILFQAAGTTATFSSVTDFTVLNRILPTDPTRPVQFDGTILGRIGASAPTPGGTVYFYSPGGILAGPTSVFDVGNLGLTSSPVAYDVGTGVFDAADTVSFGTANAGSLVSIAPGSSITANGYVAIVAPAVFNDGSINLSAGAGSGAAAALVAANAANITFSPDGLFNITVTQGTSASGTVLGNSGSITGATAGAFPTGAHRIYMVAVPQNQAITMAIASGSQLGFDIAGAADVAGNAVILSAGYDVSAGNADLAPSANGGTGQAAIQINGVDATSAVTARATANTFVYVAGGDVANFASDLDVSGAQASADPNFNAVQVRATDPNSQINIAGNLFATALDPTVVAPASGYQLSRFAAVDADNSGSISIGGSAFVTNNITGAANQSVTFGTNQARLNAVSGGSISVSGGAVVSAIVTGGTGTLSNSQSTGSAVGGQAAISASGASTISILGDVVIQANGSAGAAGAPAVDGGNGTGGNASLVADGNGSSVTLGGNLLLTADGFGASGSGCTVCGDDGGVGQGGFANLSAINGAALIDIAGTTLVSAEGRGGDSASSLAGGGFGGTAQVVANQGGSIRARNLSSVTAGAAGGSGLVAGAGAGAATGGGVVMTADQAGSLLTFDTDTVFSATATGGVGGGCVVCTTDGGRANGGTITANLNSGSLLAGGSLAFDTSATGGLGAGAGGGIAVGGTINFTGTASSVSTSVRLDVVSNGTGGAHSAGGQAGSADGGRINFSANVLSAPSVSFSAVAQGGDSPQAGGIAGFANGGIISASLGSGSAGDVSLNSGGFGGSGALQSNFGRGGRSSLTITGTYDIGGPLGIYSHGSGGNTSGSGSFGGNASGGIAELIANGGTLNATRGVTVDASAFAGSGQTGGSAFGGVGSLFAFNGGTLNLSDAVSRIFVGADGFAGMATDPGGSDGDSNGGNVSAVAASGGTLTISAPSLELFARGLRNSDSGVGGTDGGRSFGGNAQLRQDGSATVTVTGDYLADVSAEGGHNFGGGDQLGGSAQGGSARIFSRGPGSLSVAGQATLKAIGDGGDGLAGSGTSSGGDGSGGSTDVISSGGSISIGTGLSLAAYGTGGDATLDGNGGRGFGGFASVETNNGATGTSNIVIGDGSLPLVLDVSALGGNAASTGQGGDASAGNAQAFAFNGNVQFNGTLDVNATATAGGSVDGLAGSATGGTVNLIADVFTLTYSSDVRAAAGANGGNASGLGNGGAAQGGLSQILARNGGTQSFQGGLTVDATAFGGDSSSVAGNGGAATGGIASLNVRSGGDISVIGDTTVDAGAAGGNGDLNTGAGLGGNGLGGTARIAVGVDDLNDAGGGSITLGSFAQILAKGVGGDAGQAGNGTGGTARAVAWNGTLSTGATSNLVLNADGDGGFGNAGGDGGNGTAGSVFLFAGSSLNGASTITVGNVTATATGFGGFGNRGLNPGDTGGNGGSGTGGMVIVTAAAGNGNLSANFVNAQAGGFGGGAGDGGNNVSGTGGTGGIGGLGTGGIINVGTESATATPLAQGTGNYGTIQMSAQGQGGAGGLGGSGAAQGLGGDGGDAVGGAAVLLVRGSTVTVSGTTSLFAGATGGNGGSGSTAGVGGDATVGGNGGVGVTVTNRFQVPAQRGTLNAGDILASAPVQAGSGSVRGVANVADSPISLTITNADATVGRLQLFAFAANPIVNGPPVVSGAPSAFAVTGGTLTANGRVDFATDGDVSLSIDNGTVNVPRIDVSGRNWIAGVTPVAIGTLNSASTIDLGSRNDLVANVNISAASDLFFSAGGDILFADIDAGGNLLINSGGTTNLGNLSVIGNVDLLGAGSITTLAADAGGYLNYESTGSVSTGALAAGQYVEIDSLGGAATVGNVDAGDYFTLQANGPVTVGNITAGIVTPSTDPLATYRVGVAGNGNVTVGSVQARTDIGLLANGGTVTAGALSGRDMLVLASTGATINGAVAGTGRVLFADATMAVLGGNFDTFDPNPVFAAAPVRMAGPIFIGASAQGSAFFKALTGSSFTATGTITSTNQVLLDALGNVSAASGINGGPVNVAAGGTATLGGVNSTRATFLNAQGDLTVGNVNSVDRVLITSAGGNVATGNIVSNPVVFSTPAGSLANTVHIGAAGNVTTGSIVSTQSTTVAAGQNISVGQINSRFDIALLPGQSLTAGNLFAGIIVGAGGTLTGANGAILIGNPSNLSAAGGLFNLDYAALFNAPPARTGGTVQLNGQAIGNVFRADAGGDFSGNGIAAFTELDVESGGLVTVRGIWGSPQVEISSNDIAILPAVATSAGGSIRGLSRGTNPNNPIPGSVDLISLNSSPALIGDGLTGSGYSLSNAELQQVITGTLTIGAIDNSANLVDMLIGNLTVTAMNQVTVTSNPTPSGQIVSTTTGGVINGATGRIIFATGVPTQTGTPTISGGIRVNGALAGSAFASGQAIEFDTTLFELDAGTGSVKIADANNALGGLIEVNANHIHMADSAILTKLEADPFYAGRIADLNAPASVSRTDGIFNALALDLFPGSTFYIQNTGTATTPAGFVSSENVDVTPPASPPTGGIEVVVNGQFVTSTGTLTGRAAYDALIASGPDFTGFSVNGQLNACLFIGGCATSEDPIGGISSEIEMISDSDLSDSPVVEDEPDEANSEEQSEEEQAAEEDVDGSPIAPPAPLIDTRPLNPPATITEPVAGSGNPALIGSVVNEGTAQEDQQ